jgi:hypothetical protein
MHDVTMKPVRINDNGAFSATKILLLFICASITVQCFSVSAASIPWTSAGPGRVVRTKHGNLRGLTLPGGAAQPQTTTALPGIFTDVFYFKPEMTNLITIYSFRYSYNNVFDNYFYSLF